jgi:hypothetical protein
MHFNILKVVLCLTVFLMFYTSFMGQVVGTIGLAVNAYLISNSLNIVRKRKRNKLNKVDLKATMKNLANSKTKKDED